ncbi:MAG: nicotinate phosphoribosyltransferase [Waddliaceae bacterium]
MSAWPAYSRFYTHSLALMTDLYQLTMAYGYWKNGLDKKEAVFHLFFRKPPFRGGFTVAAGLENAIDYLKKFRFHDSDLAYLASLKGADGEPLFTDDYFDYLAGIEFSCDVDAVPEGTIVFPYEPLLRLKGPLVQAQLFETPLLTLINFSSLIATKASRICIAARGDSVIEFGLRRAQGIDGALTASRAAFIGGCDSTSNVLAGKLFGIPVMGTHSHSWVMIFDEEVDSFKAFAKALPSNCVFLVDTYNSIQGVKKAITIGKWLNKQGKRMLGIRLDSGDLGYLSKISRRLLDDAGFPDAKIVASNELDENVISDLKRQGAAIAVWGVGTNLVTAKDQPALDGVYKLSAVRDPGEPWSYRLKLSEQMTKISNPGIIQIRRYYDEKENIADALYDVHTDLSQGCHILDPLDPTREKFVGPGTLFRDLLVPIFRDGRLVYAPPPLTEIRDNTQRELAHFHEGIKRFLNPHQYVVGMEKQLYEIKYQLIKKARK